MKKTKKKTSEDKKIKVHDCKFVEFYYDDLDKGMYCNNTVNSGKTYCDCDNIFLRNYCPFSSPDDREAVEITFTESDKKAIEEYREKLRGEVREMLNTVHRYLPRINKITELLTEKRSRYD